MNLPLPSDRPAAAASTAPPDQAHPTRGPGGLGMWLFILALGVLFAASMTGYLIIRARSEAWPPPGMPRLPAGLWVSTVILLVSSATMHLAVTGVRRDRQAGLIVGMLVTTLLGVCFLVSQAVNWGWLIAVHATAGVSLYLFLFYLLTGLHALHIVGGLVLLAAVTQKSFAGKYRPDYYPGVRYAARYWHFLDLVWLVMFTVMFLV